MADTYSIDRALDAYKVETRRRHQKDHCYFIQRQSDKLIKIGFSCNVQERSYQLATEVKSLVTVLGVIKGGLALEKLLHTMFEPLHVSNEWHQPKAELLQYIAENAVPPKEYKKRKPRKPKEPRQPRPKIDWKARRIAVLVGRLNNPKDFVQRRAIGTLAYEFGSEIFPILREHQAKDINPLVKWWVDEIIELFEKHEQKKAA
jgi:hypothetical protein